MGKRSERRLEASGFPWRVRAGYVEDTVPLGQGFLAVLRFSLKYHSTIAPHSSLHLPPALYNVFLTALQFSPVSIIPPFHESLYCYNIA